MPTIYDFKTFFTTEATEGAEIIYFFIFTTEDAEDAENTFIS